MHFTYITEKSIKRPFNLMKVFSLSSLLAIVVLMAGLSWILEEKLEEQLLTRDKLMAAATVQVETKEYLGALPFDQIYKKKAILYEILHTAMAIPGSTGVQIIGKDGKIGWSSEPGKNGTYNKNSFFKKALEGKTGVDVLSGSFNRKNSQGVKEYWSDLYVPIKRGGEVLGVVQLHRKGIELMRQLESLEQDVEFYCGMFGMLLYLLMMFIIVRASRALSRQHDDLLSNAKALEDMNEELKKTQVKLIQQERLSAIGEVCGAVAHGLKNPLAGIRSAVQLLGLREASPKERAEVIVDTMSEVDRLTRRLNDLLNFIRPFQLSVKEMYLKDLITSTTKELLWKIEEKKLNIEVTIPDGLSVLRIDTSILEEVLLIVLTNAIEASVQGGTISFVVEQNEDNQILHLKDQGEGISCENLPKVFDQFFTTKSQGVGLGLYLCKKYVELHGGLVSIDSFENQGATVHIILPLPDSAPPGK